MEMAAKCYLARSHGIWQPDNICHLYILYPDIVMYSIRKHRSAYTWKRNVYVQKMQSLWVSIPFPPKRWCFKSHRSMVDSTTPPPKTYYIVHINVTQADISLAPAYRLSYTTRADDNTFALEKVYLWKLELWFFGYRM